MYCRFWILVLPIQLMACALSTHAIIWWKKSWSVTYYTVWTWQFVINRLYRRYLCTSNVGQFCGMPFPWLCDHQSRSACASAFWKVRPILTKTPENLQFKTRALYHDLFTKWEGKIRKYLSQGLTSLPRAVRMSLCQAKYFLVQFDLTLSICDLSYYLCWAWLGWKWWKFLVEYSELHMLNETLLFT